MQAFARAAALCASTALVWGAGDSTVDPGRVTVVVSDAGGRPLADLQPQDFDLLQCGKPQNISRVTRIPSGRTLVFLVDDAGMSPASLDTVRQALHAAVHAQTQAGNWVAILSARGGSGFLRKPGQDPSRLEAAVSQLAWSPTPSPSAFLETLADAAADLKRVPGGKILLSVSSQPLTVSEAQRNRLQSIAGNALRSSAALCFVILQGAPRRSPDVNTAFDWEVSVSAMRPPELAIRRKIEPYTGGDPAAYLAGLTGGTVSAGAESIEAALADQAGAYRIEWTPEVERKTSSSHQHRLEVRVKRADAALRLQGDFAAAWTPASPPGREPPSAKKEQALFSLFDGAEIPVRLTPLLGGEEGAGRYVDSLLHIGPQGILLQRTPDGCYTANLEILIALQQAGSETRVNSRVSALRVCGASAVAVRARGLAGAVRTVVPVPGLYNVRAAVRNVPPDATALRGPRLIGPDEQEGAMAWIGAASRFIEAPDLAKPAISAITLSALPSNNAFRPATDGDPAIRHFRAGQTIECRFQTFHQTSGAETQMRILRDGREIVRTPAAGTCRLPDSLTPGPYVFEVAAGPASGWIDFEIVN